MAEPNRITNFAGFEAFKASHKAPVPSWPLDGHSASRPTQSFRPSKRVYPYKCVSLQSSRLLTRLREHSRPKGPGGPDWS
jgi:hypothetical protein